MLFGSVHLPGPPHPIDVFGAVNLQAAFAAAKGPSVIFVFSLRQLRTQQSPRAALRLRVIGPPNRQFDRHVDRNQVRPIGGLEPVWTLVPASVVQDNKDK
jgi:hypothetical protein